MKATVIIIGAGAAGLMAARELSAKSYNVIVLEGHDRPGGRIQTQELPAFSRPVETGAEFVHGNLPLTISLLREAGIQYQPVAGKMIRVNDGQWKEEENFIEGWDILMQKMQQLQQDITIHDFLQAYFSGDQYNALRATVQAFAEGFDVADITKASVLSVRNEWMKGQEEQYRITGGYGQLVHFLVAECRRQNCLIRYGCRVKKIQWEKNAARAVCDNGQVYAGSKMIITVSPAVLSGEAILFDPGIPDYLRAAAGIGFGSVIKVILQFKSAFREKYAGDTGFIFSNEAIPTWWTQFPDDIPLLTGWLGGPPAMKADSSPEAVLQSAIQSLSAIFKIGQDEIKGQLTAWHVADWKSNPYTFGAYSYSTLQTAVAREVLNRPVAETLYFAGEALYDGEASGTVEAALVSGKAAADIITGNV